MSRYWRCRRVKNGIRCDQLNLRRKQHCTACGGPRPKRRQPAHKAVLASLPYEAWEAVYGPSCGICGAVRKPGGKRLHRDHEHRGAGRPRGILCFRCNSALRPYMDLAWLRAAVAYLERAESVEWQATEEAA
jgi:hypothetical protein